MARKSDFAAVLRTQDMHRLTSIKISCARPTVIFSVLFHAMLPSEGSRLHDPNQNTHLRLSAHHEEPGKTANRSWKEQQGKCMWRFFFKKMWSGKD